MIGLLFGFLAAVANAVSSVLQRRAGREEDSDDEMSLRMITQLIRKPVWLFGILAVIAGFLLQAVALSFSALATVEPILVMELPITIVLAWRFLGEPMGRRESGSIVAMTVGLAGLIYFLSPSGGNQGKNVPDWKWGIALGIGLGIVALLAWWGERTEHDMKRAAIYGAATGAGFGVTAGLIKGMTEQAQSGFVHIFLSWQLYLMIATGAMSMYLLQNAMSAGKLVAAQPGFTLVDPVVAILWGIFVFDEKVQHGLFLLLAVLGFALMVGAVIVLSQSKEVKDAADDSGGGDEPYAASENEGERTAEAQH